MLKFETAPFTLPNGTRVYELLVQSDSRVAVIGTHTAVLTNMDTKEAARKIADALNDVLKELQALR